MSDLIERLKQAGLRRVLEHRGQTFEGTVEAQAIAALEAKDAEIKALRDAMARGGEAAVDLLAQEKARIEALETALREAREWIAQELDNIGGCDHLAGICVCGDRSLLSHIDEVLNTGGDKS